jgi:hypothetical protein
VGTNRHNSASRSPLRPQKLVTPPSRSSDRPTASTRIEALANSNVQVILARLYRSKATSIGNGVKNLGQEGPQFCGPSYNHSTVWAYKKALALPGSLCQQGETQDNQMHVLLTILRCLTKLHATIPTSDRVCAEEKAYFGQLGQHEYDACCH